jgi:hypothetical protein
LKTVSRFDLVRARRWQRRVEGWALRALFAVAGFVVLILALGAVALMFQFFFRYEYLQNDGVLWRIDRMTQQMCQVRVGEAKCTPDSPSAPSKTARRFSTSTSTSISTSLSTSTSLKAAVRRDPR